MNATKISGDEIDRELDRMESEAACELPELSDPTPRQRAERLLACDDPPVGEDCELCERVARE